jgi:uncharacterized protein
LPKPADQPIPPLAFPRHARLWPAVAAAAATADIAHDAEHVLRVYRAAMRIAAAEGADVDLCGAAALLHDLVPIPKDSPERAAGGERSAAAGEGPLREAGYADAEVDLVVGAIARSSWSRGLAPDSLVGAVLQDADRLDAIGIIGLMRNMATAQAMATRSGRGRFYDPVDPFADAGRALDDRENALDHLPRKLLRLAQGMHTATGRAEAAERHETLLRLIETLRRELAFGG